MPPATVALFIAYLFERKYAVSTARTYVSAIGYYHRLAELSDPTKVTYIVEMFKGYSKLGRTHDSRLPVTLPILSRLAQVSSNICTSHYDHVMFKAMCSLAFYAFLRIGEITVDKKTLGSHTIQISNLFKVLGPSKQVESLTLYFRDFKHRYNEPPVSISIAKQTGLCPVQSMIDYLKVRGSSEGPIFITSSGVPVSRSNFSQLLSLCFKACNLDASSYKGHSFRIGAATYAAQQGLSDARIRALGRWSSDAFKKYIRTSTVSSL